MTFPSFNLAQTNQNQSIETVLIPQESSDNSIPTMQFLHENSLGLGLFLAIPLLIGTLAFLGIGGLFQSKHNHDEDQDENKIPTFLNLDVAINNVRLSNYLKVNIMANVRIKVENNENTIQTFGSAENFNELTISNFVSKRIENLIRQQISNLIKQEKSDSKEIKDLKTVAQKLKNLSEDMNSFWKSSDGVNLNYLSESIKEFIDDIEEDNSNQEEKQEQLSQLITKFNNTIEKIESSTKTNDNQSVLNQNLTNIHESLMNSAGEILLSTDNSEESTKFTGELKRLIEEMKKIYESIINDTNRDDSQPMELSSELKNTIEELKKAKKYFSDFESQQEGKSLKDDLPQSLKTVQKKIDSFEQKQKEIEEKQEKWEGDITSTIKEIKSNIINYTLEEQLALMDEVYNIEKKKISSINQELLGLKIEDFIITNVEENDNYNPNSLLDSLAIGKRNELMQDSLENSKLIELETNKIIEIQKLKNEKVIKLKKLKIDQEIEEKEMIYETQSLRETEEIQLAQLEQERKIEQKRLEVQAAIQMTEEQENATVEREKMKQEEALAEQTKNLQITQLTNQQEVEEREITILTAILQKEKAKLDEEIKKVKVEESIKTAIEEEKEKCRLMKAENTAKTAKQEAEAIKGLAEAEGKRYQLIPPNNTAQMNQMIKELLLEIIKKDKLPEVLEKLTPQAGVLGNNNFYTFPAEKGDGVNQLMLSSSGMLLLKTLLDNMKSENGTKT
ncbi:MAG TPA: hypothetical protein DCF68_07720 [Cyanothece sp. UBA12306]|nr:hypothetical protein [Cyanothece sp. UBA12306]